MFGVILFFIACLLLVLFNQLLRKRKMGKSLCLFLSTITTILGFGFFGLDTTGYLIPTICGLIIVVPIVVAAVLYLGTTENEETSKPSSRGLLTRRE